MTTETDLSSFCIGIVSGLGLDGFGERHPAEDHCQYVQGSLVWGSSHLVDDIQGFAEHRPVC